MRCAFEEVAQYRQTSPVGNDFAKSVYSLAVPGTPLGSPQDVAIADYNGDGWDDLATAVFDRNAVAVLVNDRQGGFPQYADRNPPGPSRPSRERTQRLRSDRAAGGRFQRQRAHRLGGGQHLVVQCHHPAGL